MDKDIHIDLTVPKTVLTHSFYNATDPIRMGTASNGVYTAKNTMSGAWGNIGNPGWAEETSEVFMSNNVGVGTVNQSILKNGAITIESGSEITPAAEDQTINITEGYNTARTLVVKAASEMDPAEVTSGNATISDLTYTADDTNNEFTISATETIPAPGVNTAGYISSTKGTKNTGTATVAATVDQVTVGVNVTGDGKVTPVIARTAKPSGDAWVDAASGAAVTAKPASGAYVRVDAAKIDKVATAEGKVSAAGYGTTDHFQKDAASTVTAGTNAAASAYVPIAAGTVTSGTANIGTVDVAYNTTGGNFDITGSANIPAPTATTAGYVGNGVGTLTGATNGATVAASVAKIGIAANLTGTGTKKPAIAKNDATNVDSSAATTSKPSAGFYVAVASPANTGSVTATAAVTSAGYGTTTAGQYNTTASNALTVGAAASDVTYVPNTAASFANTAAAGHTYTDISSSAPILVSNDYLYINKGYTGDVKISLAQLVPDDATISAATGAAYMLSGQSAYDSQGKLVVGSIPTYAGAYTIA